VCRRLSFRAIGRFSNASRRVACGSSTYTAYTYAVKPLPRGLSGPIDSDAVQNAAKVSCARSFARFIGGTPRVRTMSRLSPTYFLPTALQFAAGTRWVRCDVVALQTDHRLAPLPPRVRHLLDDSAAAARFALCARGTPGSPRTALVMCTQPHTYRAVSAIRLGGPDVPRPTVRQLAGPKDKCRRTVASLLGVSGGFSFVFTYPGVHEWNAGQRFGLCWDRSAG
jgi:Septum formation